MCDRTRAPSDCNNLPVRSSPIGDMPGTRRSEAAAAAASQPLQSAMRTKSGVARQYRNRSFNGAGLMINIILFAAVSIWQVDAAPSDQSRIGCAATTSGWSATSKGKYVRKSSNIECNVKFIDAAGAVTTGTADAITVGTCKAHNNANPCGTASTPTLNGAQNEIDFTIVSPAAILTAAQGPLVLAVVKGTTTAILQSDGATAAPYPLTMVGIPTTASKVACTGSTTTANPGTSRTLETMTCTIDIKDGSGDTTGIPDDFTKTIVGGTDASVIAAVTGLASATFTVKAPAAGASFFVTGKLAAGTAFTEGVQSYAVLGKPTKLSTVVCTGDTTGTQFVRLTEAATCVIAVKDANGLTRAVPGDFSGTAPALVKTGLKANSFACVDGSTTGCNSIKFAIEDHGNNGGAVGQTITVKPNVKSFANGAGANAVVAFDAGEELLIIGTPTTASDCACVGDDSDDGLNVVENEQVTCTITVKDGVGATTGLASDFGATIAGGTSLSIIEDADPNNNPLKTYKFTVKAPSSKATVFKITPAVSGTDDTVITMKMFGRPGRESTLVCTGASPGSTTQVRKGASTACDITVRDSAGTTTGLAKHYAKALSTGGSSITDPALPANGDGSKFSFTVTAPAAAGNAFSVTGRVKVGSDDKTFYEAAKGLEVIGTPTIHSVMTCEGEDSPSDSDGTAYIVSGEKAVCTIKIMASASAATTGFKEDFGTPTYSTGASTDTAMSVDDTNSFATFKAKTNAAVGGTFEITGKLSAALGGAALKGANGANGADDKNTLVMLGTPLGSGTTMTCKGAKDGLTTQIRVNEVVFDEPVRSAATDTDFTKVEIFAGSEKVALASGSYSGADGTSIEFTMADTDVDKIKLNTAIATKVDGSDSNVRLKSGAFKDMSAVKVVNAATEKAAAHVADETAPNLSNFQFDLDKGEFTMNFDEPVDIDDQLVVAQVSAQGKQNADANAGETIALAGSTTSSSNGKQLILKLSATVLNNVKKDVTICKDATTTYISLASAFIKDMAGVAIAAIPATSGKIASGTNAFVADATDCGVRSWSLDMNAGLLKITFDETIDTSSGTVGGIKLQKGSGTSDQVTLDEAKSTKQGTADSDVLSVKIHDDDLNAMKLKGIGLTQATSFLVMAKGAVVRDMSNRENKAYTSGSDALAIATASDHKTDQTAPTLTDFQINMNSGITLTFNEPVNINALDTTSITIQEKETGGQKKTLTSASAGSGQSGQIITVNIGDDDFEAIKLQTLVAKGQSSSYVKITTGTIKDVSSVATNAHNGLIASDHTADNVAPTLSGFDLDLESTPSLTMRFSEPVDGSTLTATKIIIRTQDGSVAKTLTAGTADDQGLQTDVTMPLDFDDANAIKALGGLATSQATTWLTATATGFIKDRAGVASAVPAVTKVTSYKADATAPTLSSFVLDMNAGKIYLTFSEAVTKSSCTASQFVLQSNKNKDTQNTQTLTLGSGTTVDEVTDKPEELTFSLTGADFNVLQEGASFGSGTSTTSTDLFISFPEGAISDTKALAITAIADTSAKAAKSVTADTTDPTLTKYTLDLDTKKLILTFSEVVKASSLDSTKITIQDAASATAGKSKQLTGGTKSTDDGVTLEITLTQADVNAINLIGSMATVRTDTHLTFTIGMVTDMVNRNIAAKADGAGLIATAYVADDTDPILSEWHINLESKTISLKFDEAVDVDTIDEAKILLHTDGNGNDGQGANVQISSSASVASTDATATLYTIVVQFSDTDAETIKQADLCSSKANCYMVVQTTLIKDLTKPNGNSIQATTTTALKQATSFTEDSTRPSIVKFKKFSMDTGEITIEFDESVTAVDATKLTLHSYFDEDESDAVKYTLKAGSSLSGDETATIKITMSETDLNAVKKLGDSDELCMRKANCYVRFTDDFATDIKGNKVNAVASSSNLDSEQQKTGCEAVTDDTTGPVLDDFSININTGDFKLTFDEPVTYGEFNPQNNIVLQSTQTGGSTYTVTTAKDTSVSTYVNTVIEMVLSDTDLLKIKANNALAISQSSTFISVNNKVIKDVAGDANANQVIATGQATAVQANGHTPDSTNPKFSKFLQYNNNAGGFTLEFDDAMNKASVDYTKITFSDNAGSTYALQHAGTATYVDDSLKTQIKYTMDSRDLNAIRLKSGLLGTSAKCFILVGASHMPDFVNRGNDASGSAAKQVEDGGFTEDSTKPELQDFVLDLNAGKLIMTFNDVVLKSSLKASEITLSSKSDDDTVNFKLTGGTGATDPSAGAFIITVTLLDDDVNNIKLLSGATFATTSGVNGNTFIYFGPLMITDASSTQVDAIARLSAKAAKTVGGVVADTTDPKLTDYSLDMDTQKLTFTFDESIVKTSFKLAQFKIQNTVDGTDKGPIALEETTEATWNTLQTQVAAKLTKASFDAIAAVATLGAATSNTYLVMSDDAAADTAARKITEITSSAAKIAAAHTEDATPPTVTDFTLDMDQKKATITFSETVNVKNIVFTKITIQPTNAATPKFDLTGGTLLADAPATTASFSLKDADVEALKLQAGLASEITDSAISVEGGVVQDMNNLACTAVASNAPIDASTMQKDETKMNLNSFTWDLNAGVLTLLFDEPALASSFDASSITLQHEVGSGAAEKVQLTAGNTGSAVKSGTVNGDTIKISLSDDDLNAVKTFENLGTSAAKTIMVLGQNALTDIAGNKLNAISAANGMASTASGFEVDSTLPTLSGVAVNMNQGTITLNFNEPIRANTVAPTKITINSNKAATPTTSYTLQDVERGNSATTESNNGLQIIVKLGATDLNELKKNTGLVTDTDDSFVSLAQNAVQDMAGKQIAALASSSAVQATSHTPDSSKPTVEAFTLNLNTRRMVITFSETMTKSSFLFTGFTLQTSSDAKPAHQYSLNAGTMKSTDDGTSFEIEITKADANELRVRLIGSEEAKTWMVVAAGAVKDTVPQDNVAVVNGANAIQVTAGGLVEDNVKPTLSSFDLNMNSGELLLKFNEAIDDSKIVASGMKFIASTATGAVHYDLTTSRVCKTCANDAFIKTACSRDADTVCQLCKTCSSSEYYATGCSDAADASCATCSACGADKYIAGACTGFSDTECADCTTSCPANSFKTADCSTNADLQCETCKVCAADEYVVSVCTSTADTVCAKHSTECEAGKYMTKTGTASADITCATCATCNNDEYEVVACGIRDRKCKACSTAENGFEYIKSACTTTADADIEECAVCGAGTFTSTTCAGLNNAACTTCKTCPDGQFASAKCTTTADTTCSACPSNCKTCGTSGKCAVCNSGFSLTVDYECHSDCPARFFKAADGTCDYCDQSAGTCTGPALSETTSCLNPYTLINNQCKHTCDDSQVNGKNQALVNGACTACNDACLTCFGDQADQCRTCPTGKVQFGYECADACPDGWYPEGNDRCRQCSANCKTCSDGTTCSECTNGKILDSGFCHDVCPDPKKFGN